MTLESFTLPGDSRQDFVEAEGFRGAFVSFSGDRLRACARFAVTSPHRWLALERYRPWWPRPTYGTDNAVPAAEYFMALVELEGGGCAIALPLVDGDVRAMLCGDNEGWFVKNGVHDPVPDEVTALFIAVGDDPMRLVNWAMGQIAQRLGSFRLRTEKSVPNWVNKLGWCTWDAFYREVSAANVLRGLESFREGGIEPGFLFLDDGWQDTRDEQLWSFGPDPIRFPRGLMPLIAEAKANFPLELFGVWHPIQGSWGGIHGDGPLGEKYDLVRNDGMAYNWPDDRCRALVHPDDASQYIGDYHRSLKSVGVDLIKVDNQATLDHFCTVEVPPTSTMRAYQEAVQTSARENFDGELLHCMSNSSDITYFLDSGAVWRSSRDYFPAQPESHGDHVYNNIVNSTWVQAFAIADWDMFHSGHPAADFHAAARAISGGPVYVSDPPGTQNFTLLEKLVVAGNRVLRCSRPALPTRDTLFHDGRIAPQLTKATNVNEVDGLSSPIGILGAFNCTYSEVHGESVAGEFRIADIPELSQVESAAALNVDTGTAFRLESGEASTIVLQPADYALHTVSPIENGLALFGLIDKFNGARAIERVVHEGTALRITVVDGGRFGWFSEASEFSVEHAGKVLRESFQRGVHWVDIPRGSRSELVIRPRIPVP